MVCREVFRTWFTLAVLVSCLSFAVARELPKGFRLEPVLDGLTDPSALAATPDGRILIAERTTGNLLQLSKGLLDPSPLCSVAVNAGGEAGLLGVAVHPDFVDNGWIYLYYTALSTGKNKVTRFTVGVDSCGGATDVLADLGGGGSLLRNGGGIGFGADGKLYVASGDVENPANGQDTASLMGKVLRVNDDGSIPADNPDPGSLVYAVGVRDGRGLTLSQAGQVYISDVGDDVDSAHDEMNAAAAGGNLGWDDETGQGGVNDEPLVSWLPTVGIYGISTYTGQLFPDVAADGLDNDHDAWGPDRHPGVSRVDDNGSGVCIGSQNNGNPCTADDQCVPLNSGEPSHFCELRDEEAEYCPGGFAAGDDVCGSVGAAGVDEPDESYVNNVFAASDLGIQRAVVNGSGLDQLSSWNTFFDATDVVGDCPTGWTGLMAGRDGWLYALATQGGGAGAGALYRIVHEGAVGPREVSSADSYFPLRVAKTTIDNRYDVYWEDLRDDAKQPQVANGTTAALPAREYTVWKGDLSTIASGYTHVPATGLQGIAGDEVNGAYRKRLVLVSEEAAYFLVSARSANYEGTLGSGVNGERPGAQFADMCILEWGFWLPPWNLFTCGRDFTILDAHGHERSLYDVYRGHPVVLDFSGVWCPPCHSEANVIEGLYQDYKDRDVEILTVLMDEDSQSLDFDGRPIPAECRNWEDRPGSFEDHTFECWVDPNPNSNQEAWPRYNSEGALPTNVVLDSGMLVIYADGGYNEATIRQRLNQITGTDSCIH